MQRRNQQWNAHLTSVFEQNASKKRMWTGTLNDLNGVGLTMTTNSHFVLSFLPAWKRYFSGNLWRFSIPNISTFSPKSFSPIHIQYPQTWPHDTIVSEKVIIFRCSSWSPVHWSTIDSEIWHRFDVNTNCHYCYYFFRAGATSGDAPTQRVLVNGTAQMKCDITTSKMNDKALLVVWYKNNLPVYR